MHSKHAFGLLLFPLLSISIKAQSVLFYNTENLFDTIDDKGVNDGEFLPEGTKEFGSIRYRLCIRQTSRALRLSILSTALPLELIGLCEVENRTVLDDLKNHRGLRGTGDWQIIHYDSPDRRGIDCAALLNTDFECTLVLLLTSCAILSRSCIFPTFSISLRLLPIFLLTLTV